MQDQPQPGWRTINRFQCESEVTCRIKNISLSLGLRIGTQAPDESVKWINPICLLCAPMHFRVDFSTILWSKKDKQGCNTCCGRGVCTTSEATTQAHGWKRGLQSKRLFLNYSGCRNEFLIWWSSLMQRSTSVFVSQVSSVQKTDKRE